MLKKLSDTDRTWLKSRLNLPDNASDDRMLTVMGAAVADGSYDPKELVEQIKSSKAAQDAQHSKEGTEDVMADTTTLSSKALGGNPRVKAPSERYSTTKSVAKHSRTGLPVQWNGRDVENPSELEKAKLGAFFKYLAMRDGTGVVINEHERQLVDEMFVKDSWNGDINNAFEANIPGERVKALLADSPSGGISTTPYFVDEALVTAELLHSELLPYVEIVDVGRGNSTFGATAAIPTLTWGTAEGTAMSLYSTNGLVSPMDTNIFPCVAAVEFGRDYLSDQAYNIGENMIRLLGERGAAELDRVIAIGDGTTQPQGIFNTSGLINVNAALGSAGPLTVGDAEALVFAIGKQYRTAANGCAFVGNDTTYRRFRAVPFGEHNAARAFGMNEQSYQILEYPYRVQNNIPDGEIAFCALRRYRMYRRMGQEVRWETTGQTLALKNTNLLVVRSRYSGLFTLPQAAAYMPDAQIVDT